MSDIEKKPAGSKPKQKILSYLETPVPLDKRKSRDPAKWQHHTLDSLRLGDSVLPRQGARERWHKVQTCTPHPHRQWCWPSADRHGRLWGVVLWSYKPLSDDADTSFWLIRASRPIHHSCPRTTVCADVMLVGSRSRVEIPAPAWSRQIKDRLRGVAPYRYPPTTSSKVSWSSPMDGEPIHLHRAQEEPVRFFNPRSVGTSSVGSSARRMYRSSINSNSTCICGCWVSQKYPGTCISFRRTCIRRYNH
jgi:hypothetical protein